MCSGDPGSDVHTLCLTVSVSCARGVPNFSTTPDYEHHLDYVLKNFNLKIMTSVPKDLLFGKIFQQGRSDNLARVQTTHVARDRNKSKVALTKQD